MSDLSSMFYIISCEIHLPDYFLALLPFPQHRIPQLSQDGRLQLIVHHYRKQLYVHIVETRNNTHTRAARLQLILFS
jgi:hypothetical protein